MLRKLSVEHSSDAKAQSTAANSLGTSTTFTKALLACAAGCWLVGCDQSQPIGSPSKGKASVPPSAIDPTNTGTNARDRDPSAKTPFDQNENTTDIAITADIRKRVVDSTLSVNAHNVKIITQDHKVTLRGPVNSDEEKRQLESMALAVAGEGNVDNQLDVKR